MRAHQQDRPNDISVSVLRLHNARILDLSADETAYREWASTQQLTLRREASFEHLGAYCAALGFDAVVIPAMEGHGRDYYVVLSRDKLKVSTVFSSKSQGD
jgi:hypothetical protein